MILIHEYPLCMADHLGFRRFVGGLNPDFQIISHNTLRNDILKMFEDCKCSLKKLLEVNQGRIAVTTDLWIASNKKKGYMTITAHFVDDDWVLRNRTLRKMKSFKSYCFYYFNSISCLLLLILI